MLRTRLGLGTALSLLAPFAFAQSPEGDAIVRSSDSRILLRFATFDPLATVPPVPEALRCAGDTHLWIVQFASSPTDEDREAIRRAGGVIRGFLPHDAHVVQFVGDAGGAFANIQRVRWVGGYHPAYRLEGALLAELAAGTPVPDRLYNMVMANKRGDKAALEAKIVAMGGRVHDRHLGGILFTAELTSAQLLAAARFDEVLWIDRWVESTTDMNNSRIQQGSNAIETAAGYTGSGIRGHLYEGAESGHADFTIALTPVRSADQADTHGHCTAGCIFGNGTSAAQARGHAPDARGYFTDRASVQAGWSRYAILGEVVNVHNCMFTTASWGGSQGPNYTSVSVEADDIVFDHRIPWTNSMSNLGNQDARPEAWAKNVIAIGGLDHQNNSNANDDVWGPGGGSTAASIGPAADGRLKPDLCSYYENVWTSDRTGAAGYSAGDSTTTFGGTSAATPITAGLNALAIQMYTDHILNNPARVPGGTRFQNRPYAQTLKALQIACASQYPVAQATRAQAGWGYANVNTIYTRRDRMTIIPEDEPITQGATHTYQVRVLPGETNLRVCMTYLDPPGIVAAAIDRVNDLTLRVTSPGGTNYWGNNGLAAGNTSSSGGSANTIDTVECVVLNNPAAGVWTVTITAPVVATDAHVATAATDATYALVVNGANQVHGSGCARYFPDISPTGSGNYYPWGGYPPSQLATIFTGGNSTSVGGTVYYNITVSEPLYVTALDINVTAASAVGTDLLLDVWRTGVGGSHVGNETNPAVWNPMSAGKGVAAAVDTPSRIDLSTPFYLTPGTYGIAVVSKNFAHRYTDGTGANQNYSTSAIALAAGSSTSGPLGGTVFSPRVSNTNLLYRTDAATGTNMRYQSILRRAELGTAGTITGLAYSSDGSGTHWNSSLLVRMSHVPAGHVMSTTFATNLPTPVTVLDQQNHTFEYLNSNWQEIGLQNPFAYNGTSDVVVEIIARGNWQPNAGTFWRGSDPRVFDASWVGLAPATGAIDNAGARMRVSFNCANANEYGASCGPLQATHSGSGQRNSTFQFRVTNAPPNLFAFISLGLNNGAPFPISITPFGWTNCHAWHGADVIATVATSATGVGSYPLSIPNSAAFDGTKVFGTWFAFDTSEPGDLTFSGYTRVIVGLLP
jgi:serine protease AprX